MKSNTKMMFGFLIGALAFGSIGGYAASMLSSKDITYTATNNNFKAGNVSDALDTLYLMGLSSMDASPIGVVSAYMGTTAPGNYLLCDGTTYNITDYQELADHIKNNFGSYNFFGGDGSSTFAVPDLRGEFLRGSGTNSHADQGSGSNVGIHQDGTTHVYWGYNKQNDMWVQSSTTDTDFYAKNRDLTTKASRTTGLYWHATGTFTGDGAAYYTSRPTNTSVNFIIKAK